MTDTVNEEPDNNDEYDAAFEAFSNGQDADSNEEEDSTEESQPIDEINELAQLRQERDQLRKERDHFEHSFKSQVGRVSALTKKLEGEKKEDQSSEVDYPEDIKKVLEDYPEIAGPIIKALDSKYGAFKQEVDARFEPLQQQEQQRYIDGQVALLDQHIPIWRETVNSQDYADWLSQQPEAVQGMANSIHAKDYAYLMTAYSATKTNVDAEKHQQANELADKRRQKLAANVTVQSTGQSKKSVAPDDFDKAWDYYASKR